MAQQIWTLKNDVFDIFERCKSVFKHELNFTTKSPQFQNALSALQTHQKKLQDLRTNLSESDKAAAQPTASSQPHKLVLMLEHAEKNRIALHIQTLRILSGILTRWMNARERDVELVLKNMQTESTMVQDALQHQLRKTETKDTHSGRVHTLWNKFVDQPVVRRYFSDDTIDRLKNNKFPMHTRVTHLIQTIEDEENKRTGKKVSPAILSTQQQSSFQDYIHKLNLYSSDINTAQQRLNRLFEEKNKFFQDASTVSRLSADRLRMLNTQIHSNTSKIEQAIDLRNLYVNKLVDGMQTTMVKHRSYSASPFSLLSKPIKLFYTASILDWKKKNALLLHRNERLNQIHRQTQESRMHSLCASSAVMSDKLEHEYQL